MGKTQLTAIQKTLHEIIDNQIRDRSPLETKLTFDRLCKCGHTPIEAKNLIAFVLTAEMNDMLHKQRMFDEEVYVAALKKLPNLKMEDEDLRNEDGV